MYCEDRCCQGHKHKIIKIYNVNIKSLLNGEGGELPIFSLLTLDCHYFGVIERTLQDLMMKRGSFRGQSCANLMHMKKQSQSQ